MPQKFFNAPAEIAQPVPTGYAADNLVGWRPVFLKLVLGKAV